MLAGIKNWGFPAHLDFWPAPAKINLFLHITGQRANGYHELQTVFQLLDYCDWLAFEPRVDGKVRRVSENPGIAAQSDLVIKAAEALKEASECRYGVDIYVKKMIPMGGGMGGGSSDAATTLCVLNRLWETGLSLDELVELGGHLGADVPVFVRGESVWAEGIGDVFSPIDLKEVWYLIIVPPVHVSTQKIFNIPELTRDTQKITIQHFMSGAGINVFESAVRKRFPEVDVVMNWLFEKAGMAKLTGTGGCVFSSFSDVEMGDRKGEDQATNILGQLPAGWRGFVTKGVNKSPLELKLKQF